MPQRPLPPLTLLPALLAVACYQPQDVGGDTGAEADGTAGTSGGGGRESAGGPGSDSHHGTVGDDRGRLQDGDFTLYWRWYGDAAWTTGSCVELRLRNDGDSVSSWQMTLDLDADLTQWVYEDGGFFWPSGSQILLEPDGRTSLSPHESYTARFCAEPAVRVTDLRVEAEASSSDGGSSSGGSDGGGTDEGETVLGDAATGLDGVRLFWHGVQDGTCLELNLVNSGSTSWTVSDTVLDFPEDVALTDYWEALFRVQAGDLHVIWPGYLGDLDPGETFRGTACLDPLANPDSIHVTASAAQTGG